MGCWKQLDNSGDKKGWNLFLSAEKMKNVPTSPEAAY